jgi:hypothetical protein
VLFGIQLGGGTDINRALAYCEGPDQPAGRHRARPRHRPLRGWGARARWSCASAALVRSGVTCVVLLALSDEGAPAHDPRPRRRPRRARRALLRLHARRVPGAARGRHRTA